MSVGGFSCHGCSHWTAPSVRVIITDVDSPALCSGVPTGGSFVQQCHSLTPQFALSEISSSISRRILMTSFPEHTHLDLQPLFEAVIGR